MQTMVDVIWNNTPRALRNNKLVEGYLETIGEIFEEIRQDILQTAYDTDYAKAERDRLTDLAANYGLQLNPKLRSDLVRAIIRDAPEIFSQLGTRGTLEWALRTSGFRDFEIDEIWVPNPDYIRRGYFKQLRSEESYRYDLGRRSYTDFVVGEEYVTDEGTFFRGYVYSDFEKETLLEDVPIYGETYTNYTQLDLSGVVGKTPYLLARIYDAPKFEDVVDLSPNAIVNEFYEELTDEHRQILLATTIMKPEEMQRIVIDTIRYLIQELQRAATTKIILVTDLLAFVTPITTPIESIEFSITHRDEEFSSTIPNPYEDGFNLSGTIDSQDAGMMNKAGSQRPVGGRSPYISTGEYSPPQKVGSINLNDRKILDDVRREDTVSLANAPPSGYEHIVYLDIGANVNFTAPPDSDVRVEGVRNYHLSTWRDDVAVVSAGQTFDEYFEEYHALILTFISGSEERTLINIEYPSP